MNRRHFLSLGPAALASNAAADPAPGHGQAGFAEQDISPSIGMEEPGGYGKAYHTAFHDACKVRAAVFDDGRKPVAVVGLDTLVVPRALVLAARKRITGRTGIAADSILVGASHSHSSGPLWGTMPGEFDHASALVRHLAYDTSTASNPDYVQRVEDAVVEAVSQAHARRLDAACSFGLGQEDQVAYNRRFRMRNGQSWSHPGQGNADILAPAGPTDPQVGVIGAWTANGALAGCVVNYACHATTNPGGISANWIYYMEKAIRGFFGPEVIVVFAQGFCGDVTQVDNRSPYRRPSGEDWSKLVGGRIGAEAVKVLLSSPRGPLTATVARSRVFSIARRVPSPERVRKSLELVQQDPKVVGQTEWIFAKETVLLDAMLERARSVDVEVQAIQVGPAAFVSAPGEMFCQLGLNLKAGSPFRFTFPTELANGCVGYIPTEEAMGASGGGYETRLTSYSNLEVTAGTRMVAAGLELLKSLQPAPAPERPKATPGRPWQYGNVPPELS